MVRHTNKRRNSRRRRQTRGRRRTQRGGSSLFSSKQEDIIELQEKIAKCKTNIPEWEAEITKLQKEQNAPKQSIFSKLFGSKTATESKPVAPNSGANEGAPVTEEGDRQVAPVTEEGVRQVAPEEGEQGGGSRRRRRRHRKK